MNDQEYEAQKARVNSVAQRWISALGLRWWRINMEWARDSPGHKGNGLVREMVAAETLASWKYMEATITWYLSVLADTDDEQLDYIVRHELAHILVNEMRWVQGSHDGGYADNDSNDHEERVCTTLGMAFGWVRDASISGELSHSGDVDAVST